MKIFSLIYDPITSSPFAVSVKSDNLEESIYGLTDVAKDFISSNSIFRAPEYMVSTPYSPLTGKAEQIIQDMHSGDEFYSLDEMLEISQPRYVYKSRVKIAQTELSADMLSRVSLSNQDRIDYSAARFFSDSKKLSAGFSIKNSMMYFDSESNTPFMTNLGVGQAYDAQRMVSKIGTSSCRRIGVSIKSVRGKPYSDCYRLNRRIKSLSGANNSIHTAQTIREQMIGASIDVAISSPDKFWAGRIFEKSDSSSYSKPELREKIKNRILAGSRGGKPGQWSARKAQLLALEYEKAGGGYRGKPKKSQRSLKKWTKEEWTTSDGKPAIRDGKTTRYLPKKAWSKLTPAQKRATNSKKIAGSKKGKQFVDNTAAAKNAGKKARGGK